MSRWKIIVGVIIIVGIGIFLYQRNAATKSQQAKIETVIVEKKTLSETVSSSGKTKVKKEATLKFQTAGRLAWVGVAVGDRVKSGQALASLDKRELQKNLTKALRDFSKEYNDWLEDRRQTYQHQVETGNDLTETIKRILEKNQYDLDKAVLDVELKDIALQYSTLISPIDGIVTQLDTPVAGINVITTDKFVISDPASLVFSASVDETDIGKISEEQRAEIKLDAFPDKTFIGNIRLISFAAEVSGAGATVFPVEIALSDAANLRSGLNGDMTIVSHEVSDTLSIPSTAVRETEKEQYVIEKSGKNWKKTVVKTGLTTGIDTEISSGLTEGSIVVIKGFQYLPKEFANNSK